ncbi:hypothetical protein E0Z10_g9587 [Xylaria hypoxylon]|uniref:NADH dehydrogenase [ubiquinone] 1 beta subcomplex subunit 9 n=1 Tax=Xylaria hypoxylon TaxID=37992 RepID=A0A4Z0YKG6_9PEZI|nr:hypothetical protein E0Z10_g9587 [Xylaria hypoxylon]
MASALVNWKPVGPLCTFNYITKLCIGCEKEREYSFKETTPLALPRHLDNSTVPTLRSPPPPHPTYICYDRNTPEICTREVLDRSFATRSLRYRRGIITPQPSTCSESHEGQKRAHHVEPTSRILALDWAVHRHLWRGQALYIRSLFEANRNIVEVRKQRALLNETEKLLETWKHPDPYCHPTAPGGSKYERNLPVHSTARESIPIDTAICLARQSAPALTNVITSSATTKVLDEGTMNSQGDLN